MTTQSPRVLVAEDEAALRDFICRNLRARGYTVFESDNGLDALAAFERESPNLIILDIMMPRMDGLEVCRRIRERSTAPIIALTALDAEADKVAALDIGVDDYLTKPFGIEELLARVRAALRRAHWHLDPAGQAPPGEKWFGPLMVDIEGRVVRREGVEIRLTPTEFALLAQLVTHAGKVVTRRQLLQRVWGPEYGDEPEYLRVYMQRLRRKIEADPAAPRYLLTEPGVGYRFAGG